MKILIYGPYGGVNFGDDFIVYSLISELLKFNNINLTITLVGNNKSFTKLFPELKFIKILNFKKRSFEILKGSKNYDLIIVGGGQQFSDSGSIPFFSGQLSNIFWLTLVSKLFKKRIIMLSIGLEYPLKKWSLFQMKVIDSFSELITLRDNGSKKYIFNFNFNFDLTYDLALLSNVRQITNDFGLDQNIKKSSLYVPNSNIKFDVTISIIENLLAKDSDLTILFSDVQKKIDLRLLNSLSIMYVNKLKFIVPGDLSEFIKTLNSFENIYTSRLHPAIIGNILGKKITAISDQEKLKHICGDLNIEIYSTNFKRSIRNVNFKSAQNNNLKKILIKYCN